MAHRDHAAAYACLGFHDAGYLAIARSDTHFVAVDQAERGQIHGIHVGGVVALLAHLPRIVAPGGVHHVMQAPADQAERELRVLVGGLCGDGTELAAHRGITDLQARLAATLGSRNVYVLSLENPPLRLGLHRGERNATAITEHLEEFVGTWLVLHVEAVTRRLAAGSGPRVGHLDLQFDLHALGDAVEKLPLLHHIGALRQRGSRRGVLRIRHGETEAGAEITQHLVRQRHRRTLEAVRAGDGVVREMAAVVDFLDVEADEELKRLQRLQRLVLVGPGHQRVAADGNQRLHLPLAGHQDLIGQRRGGEPAGGIG